MATLAQIFDQLADNVRAITETIDDVDVQVEGRMVLNPTAPCIDMYPSDPSMDPETAAFADEIGGELITIRARVGTADHEAGQDLLLALMDDEDDLSLVAALTEDPTINGLGKIDIRGRTGYALFPLPQGDGVLLGFLINAIVVKYHS